jgi:hypothetical protein
MLKLISASISGRFFGGWFFRQHFQRCLANPSELPNSGRAQSTPDASVCGQRFLPHHPYACCSSHEDLHLLVHLLVFEKIWLWRLKGEDTSWHISERSCLHSRYTRFYIYRPKVYSFDHARTGTSPRSSVYCGILLKALVSFTHIGVGLSQIYCRL